MMPFALPKLLSPEQCADIIRRSPNQDIKMSMEPYQLTPGKWTTAEWSKLRKQHNNNRVRLEQDSATHISNMLEPIDTPSKTVTVSNNDKFYLNVYGAGEKCIEHMDSSKYSICIALNDDYEGGEFYVNREPIKLGTGDGIIFSGKTLHNVTEITAGVRWSLCIWIF